MKGRQAGDKSSFLGLLPAQQVFSALLSRRCAFMISGAGNIGNCGEEIIHLEEDHEAEPDFIDNQRIAFDVIDGQWN